MQSDLLCQHSGSVHEYLAEVTRPLSLRLSHIKLAENRGWYVRLRI